MALLLLILSPLALAAGLGSSGSWSGPADARPPAPGDGFSAILAGAVMTQAFGARPEVYGPGGHTGVDLAAPEGTPVRTPVAGTARVRVSAGPGGYRGYGIYVVVDHGAGFQTLYAHLLQALVPDGAAVVAGQVLGLEGSTGFSTGPHLHFEIRISGSVVDPVRYLSVLEGLAAPGAPALLGSPDPAVPA